MPSSPKIRFLIGADERPLAPRDPLWKAPLPVSRDGFSASLPTAPPSAPTYGDYFEAARDFLLSTGSARLAAGGEPQNIDVRLEKHGAFYHPGRVTLSFAGERRHFVLNVAATAAGLAAIQAEYRHLQQLGAKYPVAFLPRVYAFGQSVPGRKPPLAMFLGEWFEGFHEFHLSRHPAAADVGLKVWDAAGGDYFLPPTQAPALYRQAAKILTTYYNLETSEQIFAWHHAAGDFVVRSRGGGPELKLVTVRRYAPLFPDLEPEAGTLFEALLLFTLNLSVRMRLDRYDGVGDVAWAPEASVAATLEGVLQGLALQARIGVAPSEVGTIFTAYLKQLTAGAIGGRLQALVARFDPKLPELETVVAGLEAHAAQFVSAVESL